MSNQQLNALLEQLKRDLDRFKSQRLKLIEAGQLELVTKPFIEIIKDNVADREAKAQIDTISNNEEFRKLLLELITVTWLSKLVDSGRQVGNTVVTLSFKLYKIVKYGWLVQCIPLDGQCPNTAIDLVLEIIKAYKDRQEVRDAVVEIVKELASDEEFKKKLAEILQ